ncbi:glycosyltransferase family 2 protein [Stenotrophomonas indicatrix]|uniref:glycosyltransferase family 2 protein n=1 Tax=Stenotrophomonas indicatrix TaxID=2045451 RepID=UPI00320A1426
MTAEHSPPLFSIVIPVKNRSGLLIRALISLRNQTFQNFEVIVIDDHSDENIVSATSLFGDINLRLVRQVDGKKGACAARNLGGLLARGNYIAYLDSDDIFLPGKLATIAAAISESQPDMLASPLLVYRGDDRLQLRPSRAPGVDEDISEFYFVHDERIQSSSIVVRREIAIQTGWNEALRKVQDPDFFIRARRASQSLLFIAHPLAILFDDQADARISSTSAEDSIRAWLDSPACPLSARARSGFKLYALSHEVAKRSRVKAIAMTIQNAGSVHPKVVVKSVYRTLAPEWLFKKTAQAVAGRRNSASFQQTYEYIQALTQQSMTAREPHRCL